MPNYPLGSLLATYREELEEDVAVLADALEAIATAEGAQLASSVQQAMMIAHRIKGSSASVGFQNVEVLAHALEDLLIGVGRAGPDPEATSLMLRAVDSIHDLSRDRPMEASADVRALAERLRAHACDGAERSTDTDLESETELPKTGELDDPVDADSAEPPTATPILDEEARPGRSAENVPTHTHRHLTFRVESGRLEDLVRDTGLLSNVATRLVGRGRQLEELLEDIAELTQTLEASQRGSLEHVQGLLGALVKEAKLDLKGLSRLGTSLSRSVREMRMIPLQVEEPFWRRVVREAAEARGVEVSVRSDLARVQLDKRVLEALREPLLHVLRNAVAHGIEAPSERLRKGKVRQGRISVHARTAGDTIVVEVRDDGRGIDTQAVLEAAVARGTRTREELEAMKEEQLCQMLFELGVSTSRETDEISGRGVGLGAVRRAIGALGGDMELRPGPTCGTVATLTVPMSILSVQGLRVRCGDGDYLVPVDSVQRTARVPRDALGEVGDRLVLAEEGSEPIAVLPLHPLVGAERELPAGRVSLVLVRRSGDRFGLAVDEIVGTGEYAVRPLPWNARKIPGATGGVVFADGAVGLVLDPNHLLARLKKSVDVALPDRAPSADDNEAAKRPRILVADDSLTARTMNREALVDAGYEVVTANHGEHAWSLLKEQRFDMLVSDVEMPGLNGLELTRRIRADGSLGELPVVLVTSLAKPEQVRRGGEAGADEYVVKANDYSRGELVLAVRRQLGGTS